MGRQSSIISTNIDRKLSQLLELSKLVNKHRPIAICIQDIPNNSKDTIDTLFPEYESHKTEYDQYNVATLTTRNETETISNKTYTDNQIITILITLIKQSGQHDEYIANIYIRPAATATMVIKALQWINNNAKQTSRLILLGDSNATGFLWDKQCPKTQLEGHSIPYLEGKIKRGKIIENWVNKNRLTCLNEDSKPRTYHRNRSEGSSIDLAILGNKAKRKWKHLTTIRTEHPGHSVMIIKTAGDTQNTGKNYKPTRQVIDINNISNEHIETIKLTLNEEITMSERYAEAGDINAQVQIMNSITDKLCKQIQTIQEGITKTTRLGNRLANKRRAIANKLDKQRTQAIINKLKKLERTKIRARNIRRRSHVLKRKQKIQKQIINKLLRTQYTSKDKELEVWDQWKQVNTSEVQTQTSSIATKDDIEALAKNKFPSVRRDLCNLAGNPCAKNRIIIGREESMRAIERLRNKKYNTPEGIKMTVFYAIIKRIPEVMHTIARISFWTGTVPRKAEYTQGTIIPKKAPGQFRIVHVSDPIAAFLETIALARLDYKLEANKLISEHQYGFTALRSRHDLVAKLIESIQREQEWGRPTCVISMDIEGAFDNVNQEILIKKLSKELKDESLTKWLASFLNNRKISIKYGQLKSQYRTVCKGVPQGSALGPILWNFVIHDIEQTMQCQQQTQNTNNKATMLLKYADDIYMASNGNRMELAQKEVDKFTQAIKRIGLNVRPEKCSYIMMFEQDTVLEQPPPLTICGNRIRKEATMNISGIKIDNKCRISRDNAELTSKLQKTASIINKLKRTKLVQSNKQWRMLIDGLIISRTIANYWPILLNQPKDREWILKFILRIIKIGFDWPASASNKPIKLILDIREVTTIINRMATNRLHLEAGPAYKYLMKARCELNASITRRYANPDKTLTNIENNR